MRKIVCSTNKGHANEQSRDRKIATHGNMCIHARAREIGIIENRRLWSGGGRERIKFGRLTATTMMIAILPRNYSTEPQIGDVVFVTRDSKHTHTEA